jgi:DNA-binding response OmpR family regulator
MAKIIIARDLCDRLLQGDSFLGRSDIIVFAVSNNDELLRVHRKEHVDLIITDISLPGTKCDLIFPLIREDRSLRSVPVIMVCSKDSGAIEMSARCGVSDVILRPVNTHLLLARAQHFLALFARESSRVPLNTSVEAVFRETRFSCRSVDVGAWGMRFETDQILAQGDSITCSFSLPGSPRIVAEAEVVNVVQSPRGAKGRRYGVRFKDLDFDSRRALQEFVALRSRTAA